PDLTGIAEEAERLLDALAVARNVSRAEIVAHLAARERARRADAELDAAAAAIAPDFKAAIDRHWETMEAAMRYLEGR
ncbi:MAG: hypothetical protein IT337_18575, partial [Thermomicrobiales bacterium]|nr:hypothetical protein [Thermomicrobiales bacterium]